MKMNQTDFQSSYQDLRVADEAFNIREKIFGYVRFWPYFIVSIAICMGLAYRYLSVEIPVYTVEAKILINNESTGQNVKQDNAQSEGAKKVDDEIEILTSRTIMEKVVKDLELWKEYYGVDENGYTDLYKKSPVNLLVLKTTTPPAGQVIEIAIKDKDTFFLRQAHSVCKYSFGEQLKSTWGTWKIEPTKFLEASIGKKIQIYLYDPSGISDNHLSSFTAYQTADQSAVVMLKIKETVPERGADVINGAIKAYNLASIEYRNKVNLGTVSFLDDRLDSIKSELNILEKRVEQYKSVRGITDLSAESSVYLNNVKENDSRLNDVNIQLQLVNEIQSYINSAKGDGNPPSTAGITDPVLGNLLDNLLKLEGQKDRLLANTPEKNPIFIPINRQIATTKKAIASTIGGIKRSFLTTRGQLQKYNHGFESSIKKLPGQEREFINIKRQQSIKEELYMYLLQKREEAGVNNAAKLQESRVIDQAHYGSPQLHNRNFTYALAFILGLIFPAGIIFGKDLLNTKIKNLKEVEEAVYAPILGELVYQKSPQMLSVVDGSRTMIAEQFRILRTKLHQIKGKQGRGKITLVTSGMPGDGKSMICRNLGAVLAAAGRKTVIIDADFRKPQLADIFKLPNEIGLSNYLIGEVTEEQIVQSSLINEHLFIIGTGSGFNNPSELLEKPAFEVLIEWLRLYFDEILIDTPPIQLVTDALILRQDHTYKSQFKYVNQLSRDETLKNFHVVFNGVSAQSSNGYQKKYAYDYYAREKPKLGLFTARSER
jgi:tyrosine-protein kinase Etk/Wzc